MRIALALVIRRFVNAAPNRLVVFAVPGLYLGCRVAVVETMAEVITLTSVITLETVEPGGALDIVLRRFYSPTLRSSSSSRDPALGVW